MMAGVNSSGLCYFLTLKEFSSGAYPGFLEGGSNDLYKGVGILFAQRFYLIFLKYPMKIK